MQNELKAFCSYGNSGAIVQIRFHTPFEENNAFMLPELADKIMRGNENLRNYIVDGSGLVRSRWDDCYPPMHVVSGQYFEFSTKQAIFKLTYFLRLEKMQLSVNEPYKTWFKQFNWINASDLKFLIIPKFRDPIDILKKKPLIFTFEDALKGQIKQGKLQRGSLINSPFVEYYESASNVESIELNIEHSNNIQKITKEVQYNINPKTIEIILDLSGRKIFQHNKIMIAITEKNNPFAVHESFSLKITDTHKYVIQTNKIYQNFDIFSTRIFADL